MGRFLIGFLAWASLALCCLEAIPAHADPPIFAQTVSACGTPNNTPVVGSNYPVTMDTLGNQCVKGSFSASLTGTVSNATSGVATSSTNIGSVAWNYGFNGATWDQLQVDGSKNLKVTDTAAETSLATIATNTSAATPAGSNVIGKVGIDQTTLGTTNAVQQVSAVPVSSAAAEACHVLKASPGLLLSDGGLAGQAEYVMLFNATSAPADGTVAPVWWFQILAAGSWSAAWPNPLNFSTGIVACYSSTGGLTKTAISTNNYHNAQVQ